LLHNPSIVFLDEPTIGLDIVVKSEIREFLKDMNEQHGTTILLTTHDLQDIEALCSRVIMLDAGSIIYDGGLDHHKSQWGTEREVRFKFGTGHTMTQMQEWTAAMPVRWTVENELSASVWIPLELNVSDVLARVVGQADITDIQIIETNTDEIVRSIYQSGSAERPEIVSADKEAVGAT
jgi:ABC-2 type transport system ATP-binding protein